MAGSPIDISGYGFLLPSRRRIRCRAMLVTLTLIGTAGLASAQSLQPRPSSDPYFSPPKKEAVKPDASADSGAGFAAVNAAPPAAVRVAATAPGADAGLNEAADNKPAAPDSKPLPGEEFKPGKVVAIVGGEPIFVADMMLEVNQILDKFMPGAPPEVRQREQGNVVRALVNKYVEQRLVVVDTKRNLPDKVTWEGITGQAEKDFDKKALPLLMEKSGTKSPAEYDANLRSMGSSLRKLRQSWSEEQIVRYFLSQKVQTEPTVNLDEMLAYYEEHREDYHRDARCRWEELMLRFDRCSDRERAKEQMVEIGNQVVYGATFAAVAEKSSHGFTAHRGGAYDWTTKGSLVNKTIDTALFELPLNELSDIIESDLGLHIIRVIEREDERFVPFVDVQIEIKEKLASEKRETNFQQHVVKLREVIPVEYLVEPLKQR